MGIKLASPSLLKTPGEIEMRGSRRELDRTLLSFGEGVFLREVREGGILKGIEGDIAAIVCCGMETGFVVCVFLSQGSSRLSLDLHLCPGENRSLLLNWSKCQLSFFAD